MLVQLAACLLASIPLSGAEPTFTQDNAAEAARSTPPPTEGPTQVALGFYVVDVLSIQDTTESFTADVLITMEWHDPRLAREAGKALMRVDREDIWTPALAIINAGVTRSSLSDQLEIDAEGNVLYRERLVGDFTSSMDLREFPFDEQELIIGATVVGTTAEELVLTSSTSRTGSFEDISPAGWTVELVGQASSAEFIAAQDRHVSRQDLRLRAVRMPDYYYLKVLFPLSLIVFMAWTVFWIDPKDLGPQIGVATSAVLTLIAFGLALSSTLPRVAYPTRADHFIFGSTILVFLALGEAIMTGRLERAGRGELARRIDMVARVVYPILFAVNFGLTVLR